MDQELFRKYYTDYYSHALGIKGYKENIEARLGENERSLDLIRRKLDFIKNELLEGGRVLIVGGGTGAELIAFHSLGFKAWMIEPDKTALEISRQKAADHNIAEHYIIEATAENLPFETASFDFVWSFTVLEHVQDYEKSLQEICRVMRPGAWGYLAFPDYRCIYEAHYKMHLPLFLPKFINVILLKLAGRNPRFFIDHVNMINSRKFIRAAMNLPFDTFRHYQSIPENWKKNRSLRMSIAYFMRLYLDIEYSISYFVRRI